MKRKIFLGLAPLFILLVAIGLYAVAVPWLLLQLPGLNRVVLAGMSFWSAALCRFAIALVLLLVPTMLMGATLPIVVAAVVRRDPRVGASTGLLYGLNTLGAVAGVFLATFVFFPLLGLLGAVPLTWIYIGSKLSRTQFPLEALEYRVLGARPALGKHPNLSRRSGISCSRKSGVFC
jgi:hypothetical protein